MVASWRHGKDPPRPEAVGILALEVYFPTQHVSLADMEAADGCPGKYTVGLDQEEMAFCSDREDAVSLALSAAHSLMDKYGVRPEEIGHVQVATESSVDRSKSIKSHLMTLFSHLNQQQTSKQQQQRQPQQLQGYANEEEAPGQHQQQQQDQTRHLTNGYASTSSSSPGSSSSRIINKRLAVPGPPAEGVDCVHACYGGTAALMAAVAWVESRRWDGRLALVVAADVALYAPGSAARPTGGCGAAALLIGPDAPLVLDPLWHGSHAEHAWDFYKPLGRLPYPTVDGPQTLVQYLGAAGWCALRLGERLRAAGELAPGEELLRRVDHFVGHSPFRKLARKGLARIALVDEMRATAEREQAAEAATASAAWTREMGPSGTGEQDRAQTSTVATLGPGRNAGERDARANGGAAPRPVTEEQPRTGPTGSAAVGVPEPHHWVQEWVAEEEALRQREQPGRAAAVAEVASAAPPEEAPTPSSTPQAGLAADDLGGAARAGPPYPVSSHAVAPAPEGCPDGPSSAAAKTAEGSSRAQPPGTGDAVRHDDRPCSSHAADADSPLASLARSVLGAAAGTLSYESYATWRLDDKTLETQLLAASAGLWGEKADDGSWLQKQVGNSYTACMWQGLASLVWRRGPQLDGRRVLLFSFGSGTVASLISLVLRGGRGATPTDSCSDANTTGSCGAPAQPGRCADGLAAAAAAGSSPQGQSRDIGKGLQNGAGGDSGGVSSHGACGGRAACVGGLRGAEEGDDSGPSDPRFTLAAMQRALDLGERLRARVRRPLAMFDAVTEQVEVSYGCPVPYEPRGDVADLATGAYYLTRVDEHSRRWYERKT